MKWFEYKMEVDELHVPDELKARLLAMQRAQQPERPRTPAPGKTKEKGKAVRFPHWRRWAAGLAAGAVMAVVGAQTLGVRNAGISTMSLALGGSASAAAYSMDNGVAGEAGLMSRSAGDSASRQLTGDKIIYSAYLTLESKDYDAARAALEAALAKAGGWTESSSESNYTGDRRTLSLTLRVPAENYESFLTAAGETANLVSRSEQADDVTAQYTDIAGRIENLEGQRDRLRELQASAETLSDLLDIEAQLSDVQYQLESWQSQLNWYDSLIASCTVTVTLREVENYTTTDGNFLEQLAAAFAAGWQNFTGMLAAVAVALASWWPAVVLTAAVIVTVVVLIRRR